MNYTKEENDDAVIIIENTNFDTSAVVFDLLVSQIFNIFLSSTSFFFLYESYEIVIRIELSEKIIVLI